MTTTGPEHERRKRGGKVKGGGGEVGGMTVTSVYHFNQVNILKKKRRQKSGVRIHPPKSSKDGKKRGRRHVPRKTTEHVKYTSVRVCR